MLRRRTAAVVSAGAVTLAAAVFAAGPHAQTGPATFTIKEEGRPGIAMDDVGRKGLRNGKASLGDRIVLSQPVTRSDGAKGTLLAIATISTRGRVPIDRAEAFIDARFTFADGDLIVEGGSRFSDDHGSGAVAGGTGVYAGARGTLASTGGDDVITLLAP